MYIYAAVAVYSVLLVRRKSRVVEIREVYPPPPRLQMHDKWPSEGPQLPDLPDGLRGASRVPFFVYIYSPKVK